MSHSSSNVPSPWWRNSVIYQLYLRSFADSDGDGIGDLRGIIARLDYLAALGVDGIWLNPCYPSPQRDHGYDVSDYMAIEPAYGDLTVFSELTRELHARGMKLLMDVVPNHCSEEHSWFRAAVAGGVDHPMRERFYFAEGKGDAPPNDWRSVFGGPAWTRITEPDGSPGQWYLHTFTPQQPDFRVDHPLVLEHFREMFCFWFDRGVDGFRVDAIIFTGKEPGLPDAVPAPEGTPEENVWQFNAHTINHPRMFPAIASWREVFDAYGREHGKDLVAVSEAYTPRRPENLGAYLGEGRFHQSFTFDLLLEPWNAANFETAIRDNYETLQALGSLPTWTLNNHDAHRAVTRYGRRDAASFYSANNMVNSTRPVDFAVGERRARAAAMLMLALPGAAYMYMGEELGLPEVLDMADADRQDPLFARSGGTILGRDGCRIPMPWTPDAETGFGFSGDGSRTWLPQPRWWGEYAVSRQDGSAGSVLELYREALRIRPRFVNEGDEMLVARTGDLLMIRRGRFLAAVNFGDDPAYVGTDWVHVASSAPGAWNDEGVLAADSAVWLESIPR